MKSGSRVTWTLPVVISILALIDGSLHLSLDALLFRGNFVGPLGAPPGAPSGGGPPVPMPLPLNRMFVANFVCYVVLVVLFWVALRRGARPVWVDLPLGLVAVAAFLAWVEFGRPNPMGYLGYLSKTVEALLVIALIAHAWLLTCGRQVVRDRREPSIRPV